MLAVYIYSNALLLLIIMSINCFDVIVTCTWWAKGARGISSIVIFLACVPMLIHRISIQENAWLFAVALYNHV